MSANGRVFASGKNDSGQLGPGVRDNEKRAVPTLVTGLLKTKSVVQVAAGGSHTACLTTDGLVFTCGNGGRGQLGVGDTESRAEPTLVRGELER